MKMTTTIKKLGGMALVLVFVSACQTAGQSTIEDGAPDSMLDQDGVDIIGLDDSDPTLTALDEDGMSVTEMLDNPSSSIANRIIYFEFDSAKISDESLTLLEAHGNFIASNGNVSLRLEGHTDERGSREYNIALGDRRAQSVRRVFLFQGASIDQLDTISYGEEQPAMLGHEEAAWAKNRRVELIYKVN